MAGANKKSKNEEYDDEDEDFESENSESEELELPKEIQATFEGRNPEGQDYHGIKQLLLQLFLNTHVDVGQMCDMIIGQAGIGSVLKQGCNDSDDEEDVDMVEESDVYGITTVLNFTSHKETPCIQETLSFLRKESEKSLQGTEDSNFKTILKNSKLGFIINERFINIPAKISCLMLNSLKDEMKRMAKKNPSYQFDYYLMISKVHKPKGKKNGETVFVNEEEEIFFKKADCTFEYSVATKCDTGLTGKWTSEDKEVVPFRKVILFKSDKLDSILNEIQQFVTS